MKKSELCLVNIESSFNTLKECYEDYCCQKNEKIKNYIKDSFIKRFEYTYETSKKIMNKFLKKEYDKTEKELSINNIFLKTGQTTENLEILHLTNTMIRIRIK